MHNSFDSFSYQVYEVTAKTIHQLQDLIDLEQSGSYDFWNRIGFNAPTDIMAAPDRITQLTDYLSKSNIEYRMKISNVQQYIIISSWIFTNWIMTLLIVKTHRPSKSVGKIGTTFTSLQFDVG